MVGRFIHYYPGYTAEAALALPWARFLALLGAIPALQAEDDLRAVMVAAYGANPGDKGRQLRAYQDELRKAIGHAGRDEITTMAPGILPYVLAESEPGSIARERERQIAAAERLEAERRTAWEAQRGG